MVADSQTDYTGVLVSSATQASFVPEIFKFSYYANLVTDDVIGCAGTVV